MSDVFDCDSDIDVCVCVFCGKPFYMPVRKSRWVFLCVSCVCVCRVHDCEYVRAVPSVMALLETQCECSVVSVIVWCVCMCVFGNPTVHACKERSMGVCVCVLYMCVSGPRL